MWTEGADSGIEKITLTTKILCDLLDVLKGGAGILQMIWGGTVGAVWDFGKNTYKALTGDFEDMNWDNSYGNIKGGWNRLYSAGQHMNETSAMHDSYLLEEAEKKIKQQSEAMKYIIKNQNTFGVPVEKDFAIPYQPVNSGIVTDFNKLLEPKTFDNKVIDRTKKAVTANQTVNYNPTYKTDVTINESKDGKNGFENIVNFLLKKDKENLERIKVQVGMGLTY